MDDGIVDDGVIGVIPVMSRETRGADTSGSS